MKEKRTVVAVNRELIEKLKVEFGDLFSLSKMINSLLKAVAEGKLYYKDGYWHSIDNKKYLK